MNLFETLNIPDDVRAKRKLLANELRFFRYINGWLFADRLLADDFDSKMRRVLLNCANFDWLCKVQLHEKFI